MDAGDHAGVLGGQGDADRRADVPALGAEPPVAQDVSHQPRPQARPAARGGRVRRGRGRGEGEAGRRGDHHVEAVPLAGAVGGRVGQQRRQLEQLGERAGPPVGEHQRERVRALAAFVHEMHPLAADVGGELGERVQPLLRHAPVKPAAQ
jgi:hypothetical protein